MLGAEAGPSLHSLLQGPPHLLTQLLRHPEPTAWCRLIYLGSVACPPLATWLRLALQELQGRVCPGPRMPSRHRVQSGRSDVIRWYPLEVARPRTSLQTLVSQRFEGIRRQHIDLPKGLGS